MRSSVRGRSRLAPACLVVLLFGATACGGRRAAEATAAAAVATAWGGRRAAEATAAAAVATASAATDAVGMIHADATRQALVDSAVAATAQAAATQTVRAAGLPPARPPGTAVPPDANRSSDVTSRPVVAAAPVPPMTPTAPPVVSVPPLKDSVPRSPSPFPAAEPCPALALVQQMTRAAVHPIGGCSYAVNDNTVKVAVCPRGWTCTVDVVGKGVRVMRGTGEPVTMGNATWRPDSVVPNACVLLAQERTLAPGAQPDNFACS